MGGDRLQAVGPVHILKGDHLMVVGQRQGQALGKIVHIGDRIIALLEKIREIPAGQRTDGGVIGGQEHAGQKHSHRQHQRQEREKQFL